jgi:outer membrane protein OmpU
VSGNARLGLQYNSAGASAAAIAKATAAATAATGAATVFNAAPTAANLAALNTANAAKAKADAAVAKANANEGTRIEKRMSIDMVGTAETSSGITFGAKLRMRSGEAAGGVVAGARVYMQTSGFELAMGNIDGAIESMPNLYSPSVGLTGLGWQGLVTNTAAKGAFGWDSYSSSGNGAEGIEAIYSAGAFTGHVSYSDQDLSSGASAQKRAGAYGAYTFNDWTVALGVQRSSIAAQDKTVLTVGGKIGDYGVGVGFADNDGVRKIALNGSATFGATTVSAYVADEDSAAATDLSIGLGASYDLGGASVVGGVERGATGNTRADLGVSFSF